MIQSRTFLVFTVLGALVALSSVARAQTVTLRIADSFPHGHVFHQVLTWPYIHEVEKVSAGRPSSSISRANNLVRPRTC